MVEFYVVQIQLGNLTIDDVPERFREAVEAALNAGA